MVVIDPMWEMVAFSVISQPVGVVAELSAIAKIHKYKGFMKGTILFQWPWRCTTHGGAQAPKHDMFCFIRECACLFHNRQSRGHLSLFFCIQFFRQHVKIAFQCTLTSIIEKEDCVGG